jgi:hypothetical protein
MVQSDAIGIRRMPYEVSTLPEGVRRIYGETVAARNAGLLALTFAGMRMTIEAVCKDKGIQTIEKDRKHWLDLDSLVVHMTADGLLSVLAQLLHKPIWFKASEVLHLKAEVTEKEVDEYLADLEEVLKAVYG